MRNVIVLAAGVGSRLRPFTDSNPKCCIDVAEQSLIRRIVDQFHRFDTSITVNVVVGFMADRVLDQLKDCSGNINFIYNENFAITNNMESCRLALAEVDFSAGAFIVNGDCIYDDRIISDFIAVNEATIAVDSSIYLEESMKVLIENEVVSSISKEIKNGAGVYTSIDLYYLDATSLYKLYNKMTEYKLAGLNTFWNEVAINDIAESGAVSFGVKDFSGLPWVEIDNIDDLNAARKIFHVQ
jgi:L-glutamine-phosphate cytidylyltransferase